MLKEKIWHVLNHVFAYCDASSGSMMLRPDLHGNLAGDRLIGLNLPPTKRLRILDILTYDEREEQRTMFCTDLYEVWISAGADPGIWKGGAQLEAPPRGGCGRGAPLPPS